MGGLLIFGPGALGLTLGLKAAWWGIGIGAVGGLVFTVLQVHVEGRLGTLATGQDWSNWLLLMGFWFVVSFYGAFALGFLIRRVSARGTRKPP
jgi:hypothetical protein